jgi:hypothetical protein
LAGGANIEGGGGVLGALSEEDRNRKKVVLMELFTKTGPAKLPVRRICLY